jgi:hypothetical protein
MARGEDARQAGRYWTLQLSDDERTATLDALQDYYNNPDPHRQKLAVHAYEVAYALGLILNSIPEAKDG